MAKKFLCCDVFKEELLSLKPPVDMDIEFISMGMHLQPAKLHQAVSRALTKTLG